MKKLITIALLMTITVALSAQKTIKTWNKNQVIAHRGAWKNKNLPENSIASLLQAIKLKCYGSEFDVHLTKDSVIVVNHDPTFFGLSIPTSTYQELLSKKLPNGESIPTLQEYLKAGLKQKKTKLILEIKPQSLGLERDELLTKMALAEVKKMNAEPWLEYISFGYDICQFLLKNEPKAIVFYLRGEVGPKKLKEDRLTGADYHYLVFQKNPTWIAEMKKLGLKVNAWTVNEQKNIDDLLNQNAEFITTNEPELVFERIKALK